jgi:hypothetical protein
MAEIKDTEGKIALLVNFPASTRKRLKAMAAYSKTSETAKIVEAVENEWKRFVAKIDAEFPIELTEQE